MTLVRTMRAAAQAATKGPWRWNINLKGKSMKLESTGVKMLETVMDFKRWGMGGAKARFIRDGLMYDSDVLTKTVDGREHHADWFQSIDHPDADFIATANPVSVLALCDRVEELMNERLDLFDSYMEAVNQACTYNDHENNNVAMVGHSFMSSWEEAFDYLGIKEPAVTQLEFWAAIARKRKTLQASPEADESEGS